MTHQQAFNKIVRHLRKQNRRSEDGGCLYRGPGGLQCAIGCLIPNSEYKDTFEGVSVYGLRNLAPSLKGIDILMLKDMQDIHDTYDVRSWETAFAEVAWRYSLKMPKK